MPSQKEDPPIHYFLTKCTVIILDPNGILRLETIRKLLMQQVNASNKNNKEGMVNFHSHSVFLNGKVTGVVLLPDCCTGCYRA